jgi:hypothetical protein
MNRLSYLTIASTLALAAASSACSSEDPGGTTPVNTAGTATGGTATGGTATGGTATGGTATGGTATGGTATGGTTGTGVDSTQSGLQTFVASGAYKETPWIADVAAPRDGTSTSPHGRVRVWFNDTLKASQVAGNGMAMVAHTTGSVAVKEHYDAADALTGHSVMVKEEGAATAWTYYCEDATTPANCGGESPTYGTAADGVSCSFCHGGLIFTIAP